MDNALEQAHEAAFENAGQVCTAGSRTFVQEDIYDEFLQKSIAMATKRSVGDPFNKETQGGPQVTVMTYLLEFE